MIGKRLGAFFICCILFLSLITGSALAADSPARDFLRPDGNGLVALSAGEEPSADGEPGPPVQPDDPAQPSEGPAEPSASAQPSEDPAQPSASLAPPSADPTPKTLRVLAAPEQAAAPVAAQSQINVAPGQLQAALDNAATVDGDTLVLAAGSYTGPFTIPDKQLTIKAASAGTVTLTAASGNTVNITGPKAVYFEDLKIENTSAATDPRPYGVCSAASVPPKMYFTNCTILSRRGGIATTSTNSASSPRPFAMMTGVEIVLDNTQVLCTEGGITDYDHQTAATGNQRGIQLFDVVGPNSFLTLKNGSSVRGFGYVINLSGSAMGYDDESVDCNGLAINVQDSTLSGWGCLNIWTANTMFNISGSRLLGINPYADNAWNSFSTIVLNEDIYITNGTPPNVFDISNTTISNYLVNPAGAAAVGVTEQLVRVENQGMSEFTLDGVTFADTTGTIDSAFYSMSMTDGELAEYVYNNVSATNVVVTDPNGNVTPVSPVANPTALALDKTSATLAEGDALTLAVASVTPYYANQSVDWASSDTTVATVDANGKVTAVKEGGATITATAKYYPAGGSPAAASCALTVKTAPAPTPKPPTPPPTTTPAPVTPEPAGTLWLSGLPQSGTMLVGDKITLVPQGVADTRAGGAGWVWDSAFWSATFNSPATFTAKKTGTTAITYTAQDGQAATVTVTILAKSGASPKTGDDTQIVLWLILAVLAGGVIATAVYLRRRRSAIHNAQ